MSEGTGAMLPAPQAVIDWIPAVFNEEAADPDDEFLPGRAGPWDGQGSHRSGAPFSDSQLVYSLAFSKPVTYKYLCLVHPDMEGTVKVT